MILICCSQMIFALFKRGVFQAAEQARVFLQGIVHRLKMVRVVLLTARASVRAPCGRKPAREVVAVFGFVLALLRHFPVADLHRRLFGVHVLGDCISFLRMSYRPLIFSATDSTHLITVPWAKFSPVHASHRSMSPNVTCSEKFLPSMAATRSHLSERCPSGSSSPDIGINTRISFKPIPLDGCPSQNAINFWGKDLTLYRSCLYIW